MDIQERAEVVLEKSIEEAIGYIELAQKTQADGGDNTSMRTAAIKALQRFSDDDELVDAMCDAEVRSQEYKVREG